MRELSLFSQRFLESLCEEHRELLKGYLQHLEESYERFECPICGKKLGIHPISKVPSRELFIQEFYVCLMNHREDKPQEYLKFSILLKLEEEFEKEHDNL